MEIGEALVAMTLFISVGATFVLRGPLGKALADRIAGRRFTDDGGAGGMRDLSDQMLGELDEVKGRLAEMEERQDFTERMLTRARAQDELEAGS